MTKHLLYAKLKTFNIFNVESFDYSCPFGGGYNFGNGDGYGYGLMYGTDFGTGSVNYYYKFIKNQEGNGTGYGEDGILSYGTEGGNGLLELPYDTIFLSLEDDDD
jgi:hypothetical protein